MLEKLIALNIDPLRARVLLSPLVGAYEFRHGDAHLPSSEIDEALKLAHVDKNHPFIQQRYQLLTACVSSIYEISRALDGISNKLKNF